jgi:beta-glucosidase
VVAVPDPKAGNSLQAWTDLYDSLQQRALNTRLRIPILYGIDACHGHSNVLNAVIFPHNIGSAARAIHHWLKEQRAQLLWK